MAEYEWARSVATTLRQYIPGYTDQTLRNRKVLAILKKKGRVKGKQTGRMLDWALKIKRATMDGYGDMGAVSFGRLNRYRRAELDWRGYIMTDAASEKEKLMNQGKEAIIKHFSEMGELLMDDMSEQFCEEVYIDGNAAGNELRFHGIESFMGNSGAASGGYIATPSDTYAGLSTTLGDLGGSWTGTWPDGVADDSQAYDAWTPLIVDYTDGAWTTAADTWAEGCTTHLRYGIIKSQRSKSEKGRLDLIVSNDTAYRQFLDKHETHERIVVERGKEQSPAISLGYNDMINFDGVDVTWEYGIAATSGGGSNDVGPIYGFNCNEMEIRHLGPNLFEFKGPYFDEESMSYRLAILTYGNFTFNPKFFVKWAQVT